MSMATAEWENSNGVSDRSRLLYPWLHQFVLRAAQRRHQL